MGPEISARFKIEGGQKARMRRGKPYEAGGAELTWYTTLTNDPRAHHRQPGLRGPASQGRQQFVEMTEAGSYGKAPLAANFGSKVCSLTLGLNNKGKTRIRWVNGPEGGRASKAQNAPR